MKRASTLAAYPRRDVRQLAEDARESLRLGPDFRAETEDLLRRVRK